MRPLPQFRGLSAGLSRLSFKAAELTDSRLLFGQARRERDALCRLVAKARLGNADAQFELGLRYQLGRGVEADLWPSAKWYRRAANQSHGRALNNLAGLLLAGYSVKHDPVAAAVLFDRAAKAGDAMADNNLTKAIAQLTQGELKDFEKLRETTTATTRILMHERAFAEEFFPVAVASWAIRIPKAHAWLSFKNLALSRKRAAQEKGALSALSVDAADLGALEGKVVHEAFLVQGEADDGGLNVVRIDRATGSDGDQGDGAIDSDLPAITSAKAAKGL